MTNNIKHHDLFIDPQKPFENCKLNREQYAEILTNIVSNYKDGFVLAVNNRWGTGKTTFIKMWEQYLKNEQFKTIYFNAWENDFENDPLVALISEINSLAEPKTEILLKKFIKNALPLAKNLGIGLAKKQAAKLVDDEYIKDAASSLTEDLAKNFSNQISSYLKKKGSIKAFRDSLEAFVKASSEDKPIVFFIDELDRCRPNYAVEVLEKVKHLFSVKGIVFVLSIDKTQLENAVCGVYGSDKIDANEYLRRFIDLEYSIPEPDSKLFCDYLYEFFDFKSFMDVRYYNQYLKLLFSDCNMSLRELEKMLSHIKISLIAFRSDKIYMLFFLSLIYLKRFEKDFYEAILKNTLTTQDFLNKSFDIFMKKDPDSKLLSHLVVALTFTYNNQLEYDKQTIFDLDRGTQTLAAYLQKNRISFDFKFRNSDFWNRIAEITSDSSTNYDFIKYIKAIELTEQIRFG